MLTTLYRALRRINVRLLACLASVLVQSSVAVNAQPAANSATNAPAKAGLLRIATAFDPQTMDPAWPGIAVPLACGLPDL